MGNEPTRSGSDSGTDRGDSPIRVETRPDGSPGAKKTVQELLADENERRRIRRLWLVLALAAILSTVGGVWYVERTLSRSAVTALEDAGVEQLGVEFSGRDAVVTGELEALTAVPALVEAVAAIPGVRTVRSEVRLVRPVLPEPEVEPEPVELSEPVLGIRYHDSGVVLSGSLPSEEVIDRVLEAARAVFGFEGVVNHLVTGDVSEPDWLDGLLAGAFIPDITGDFSVDVSGGVARLVGTVPTRSMMARVEASLADALAGRLTIQSRLEVDGGTTGASGVGAACEAAAEKLVVASDELFDPGTPQLTDEGRLRLEPVLVALVECSAGDLEIAAHTDGRGSVADNLALSQAQAEAVVEFLVSGGVDPARLSATGYGEAVPVADNDAEEGRRENRRVELIPRGDG